VWWWLGKRGRRGRGQQLWSTGTGNILEQGRHLETSASAARYRDCAGANPLPMLPRAPYPVHEVISVALLCGAFLQGLLLAMDRSAKRGRIGKASHQLFWSMEVNEHLTGLAAEWNIPSASTYLSIIKKASTRGELCEALDQVLFAEGMDGQRTADGDASMLLAAAVGFVVFTVRISR